MTMKCCRCGQVLATSKGEGVFVGCCFECFNRGTRERQEGRDKSWFLTTVLSVVSPTTKIERAKTPLSLLFASAAKTFWLGGT